GKKRSSGTENQLSLPQILCPGHVLFLGLHVHLNVESRAGQSGKDVPYFVHWLAFPVQYSVDAEGDRELQTVAIREIANIADGHGSLRQVPNGGEIVDDLFDGAVWLDNVF